MKKMNIAGLVVLASCLITPVHAQAQQAVSDAGLAATSADRVTPQWKYVNGAYAVWPNSTLSYNYNPANQPVNLTTDEVLSAIQTAAARWSSMCNISFQYKGMTSAAGTYPILGLLIKGPTVTDDILTISWQPQSRPAMGSYPAFTFVVSNNASKLILSADTILSSSAAWDLTKLDGVMTRELAKGLGIGGSDVPSSITSLSSVSDINYMRTLRGDDVAACTALYGAGPDALANRTLNWAENTFPTLLKGGAMPTGRFDGYTYRYYPATNSYAGVKNGTAYFMGPDGAIQNMGPLSTFTPQVTAAGF
jgi:hypothetical protein